MSPAGLLASRFATTADAWRERSVNIRVRTWTSMTASASRDAKRCTHRREEDFTHGAILP